MSLSVQSVIYIFCVYTTFQHLDPGPIWWYIYFSNVWWALILLDRYGHRERELALGQQGVTLVHLAVNIFLARNKFNVIISEINNYFYSKSKCEGKSCLYAVLPRTSLTSELLTACWLKTAAATSQSQTTFMLFWIPLLIQTISFVVLWVRGERSSHLILMGHNYKLSLLNMVQKHHSKSWSYLTEDENNRKRRILWIMSVSEMVKY